MPDRLVCRGCVAQLAISPHTSDKSVRATSVAFPNNPDTLVQSGTNQGIEPRSLGNLFHLSGQLLACPFGDFDICGAKGIPRVYIQFHAFRRRKAGTPITPELIASYAYRTGATSPFDQQKLTPRTADMPR